MRIRVGSTPSFSAAVRRVANASPRIVPGRVVRPPLPKTPHLPPVHFFAEADVAAGTEVALRSEGLSNRTGQPIDIHEIRLVGHIANQGTFADVDVGAFIRTRLTVNGKPITNGFVPIWLLGKTEHYFSQVASGTEAIGMFVWRLSRPWQLPPGAVVEAQFQHSNAVRFAARAQIGLAGRYAERRATTTAVPYATGFVSKPFLYSDVAFDESSERDLANITERTLNVDRIIARVGVARATEGSNIGTLSDIGDAAQLRLVTMRMVTSKNEPIIRDYISVQSAFGYSRAIEIGHSIEPNDFYNVGVKKIAGPTITTPFVTWSAQLNVSILGCREEAI